MDNVLQESLEKVRQLCEKGFIDDALPVLDRLMEICPGAADDLLYEKAVIEFQCGRAKDALFDFLRHYANTQSEEVLSIIMSYSQVSENELKQRFDRNRDLLKDYPYIFGEIPHDYTVKIIWKDEESAVIYDPIENHFHIFRYPTEDSNSYLEKSVLLVNVLSHNMIGWYIKACRESWSVAGRVVPVYVYYKKCCMEALLQCVELEDLLAYKKLVFFMDKESFSTFFRGEMVWFPEFIIGDDDDDDKSWLNDKLIEQAGCKKRESDRLLKELLEYYTNNGNAILERIRAKTPRILIYTSLFTTALQYHAMFCQKNLEELGIEACVVKEKNVISRIQVYDDCKSLWEFKPDIILQLDHFRFESPFQIKNLVYISWIQDYLEYNMTKENFKKLTARDVLMVQFYHEEIKDRLKGRYYIDAPAPADETIYKPYALTDEEREKYGCDICMVCHASDVDGVTNRIINALKAQGVIDAKDVFTQLSQAFFKAVYEGETFHNSLKIRNFIDNALDGKGGLWASDEVRDFLTSEMIVGLNQPVYRQVLADWLIEAGYDNIKLWGNGWLKSPKYTKYAMGPAQNGEVLAKINQAAKIVLGNNVNVTGATRVWETMLSGGLYFCNYVPPEDDGVDIRNLLKEDEFIMFHNKQELLEFVQYYLNHDKERQDMIRRGRNAILERLTYKILMQRVLDETPQILEKQGAWNDV